jgi:hypothetical protein
MADELALYRHLRLVHRAGRRLADACCQYRFFLGADALSYAFLALRSLAALVRPVGGWLADRVGGAIITLWVFV